MAIPVVADNEDFESWRLKTNEIAALEGDLSLLNTVTKTNLVSSVNELSSSITGLARETLIRSIAMS